MCQELNVFFTDCTRQLLSSSGIVGAKLRLCSALLACIVSIIIANIANRKVYARITKVLYSVNI